MKDFDSLCIWFGLPYEIIDRQQYDSDEAYVKGIVEKFLLEEGGYQPSWRRVIWSLDWIGEVDLADKIRSFGEPVQGEWVLPIRVCVETVATAVYV